MKLLPWRRGPSKFKRASDGSMTLVEHLLELRSRLFKASVAIVVGCIIGYLVSMAAFDLLARPYCNVLAASDFDRCDWVFLAPTDPFFLRLKISLWIGLVLSAPVWLYQLWAFVAPGLHRHERRWAYLFGALSVPLFAAGTALAYFVVERGLFFLLQMGITGSAQELEVTRYVTFVMTLILAFGISFQFPVLVLLLNFSGIVSARRLLSIWRVVVFGCFAFAALTTPDPGPFGMVLLAACLSLMYFAAVGVAFINDRRRAKKRKDLYGDLADDELSPLDDTVEPLPEDDRSEPVTASEPVERLERITAVERPAPLARRYDDMT